MTKYILVNKYSYGKSLYAKRPGWPQFPGNINIFPGNLLKSALKAKKCKNLNLSIFETPFIRWCGGYNTTPGCSTLFNSGLWQYKYIITLHRVIHFLRSICHCIMRPAIHYAIDIVTWMEIHFSSPGHLKGSNTGQVSSGNKTFKQVLW